MAIPLEKWLETHVKPLRKKYFDTNLSKLSNEIFFRDPQRPQFVDYNYFFSPADGVILYQKEVKNPKEEVVEIKGKDYTLQNLMQDESYNEPSLVIGIFMTFYDVHINRIPYSGILTWKDLDSIESFNLPMLFTEKELIKENQELYNTMGYLFNNSRRINKVISGDMTYFIVQIGDYDVDVITHFDTDQNVSFNQNDRFSFIRWGSQVDLIVPLKYLSEGYTLLQKPLYHVTAGIDKLIKLH